MSKFLAVLTDGACKGTRTPEEAAANRVAGNPARDREGKSIPARCEVELDIFSGMPNPTWILTDAEVDSFVKRLAALRPSSSSELSGNLGYRGFIVQCIQGSKMQVIRIQKGTVQISEGESNVYASDKDRELERWLLNTGKPHLDDELFQIAEREAK